MWPESLTWMANHERIDLWEYDDLGEDGAVNDEPEDEDED
jgi:hypothetical protein